MAKIVKSHSKATFKMWNLNPSKGTTNFRMPVIKGIRKTKITTKV